MNTPEGQRTSDQKSAQRITGSMVDPYLGTLIDNRYKVEELIGIGGYGRVYKATDKDLKRTVALKILLSHHSHKEEMIERFKREALSSSAVNHPAVATIFDFGTLAAGTPYIVIEFLEGKSLAEMVMSGPVPVDRAIDVFIQVCDGLCAAAQSGIVHRDIKPSNIVVVPTATGEQAKILDFGLAKMMEQDEEERGATLTNTGETIGSLHYMSPEQCRGLKLDPRSDIYSFGYVMYETLTGKRPIDGEGAFELMSKHINDTPPPFSQANPKNKVPKALESVVFKCLEKDPKQRFGDALELKEALLNAKRGKGVGSSMVMRLRRRGPLSRRGKAIVMAGCFSVVAVGGYIAYRELYKPWDDMRNEARGAMGNGAGAYSQAEVMFKKALEEADKGHAEDGDKEDILVDYARLCKVSGRQNDAIALLKSAMELSKKHDRDEKRGTIYDELSDVYSDRGEYMLAELYARKAMEVKDQLFGHVNDFTGHSVARVAVAIRHQGRFNDAERMQRDSVDIQNKLHPAGDDAQVAFAYEELCRVLADQYVAQPDASKLQDLFETGKHAIELRSKLVGVNNPQTQQFAKWLIEFLRKQHQDPQAAEIGELSSAR